jgi:purine-nucleoside phosphorylase
MTLYDQVSESVASIQARTKQKPAVALVLGSGLGSMADEIDDAIAIPYAEIPHFAHSSVVGHAGRLVIGKLEGQPVVAMQGRFHFYEGYSLQTVTFPVRVMHGLGVHTLIVSNAAGGVNARYRPGDFMLIRDHINIPGMAGLNPLVGPNDERFGPRFPPLAGAYDASLRALARSVAATEPAMTMHEGVYVMVTGPSYETSAELRLLQSFGADAVGMSTVPEVVVARHMGMRVLGLSLITNSATGEETEEISHAEVLAMADTAAPKFAALLRGIIREMPTDLAS